MDKAPSALGGGPLAGRNTHMGPMFKASNTQVSTGSCPDFILHGLEISTRNV